MKNNTKILVGFLSIIILVFLQLAFTYQLQSNILDNTRQIKDVEAPLEVMAEKGAGYSIILIEEVHGALLHAQQGEYSDVEEHKVVYDNLDLEEKELRKNAKILLGQSKISTETKNQIEEQLKIIDEFNLKLIELERKGFEEIDKKELKTASLFLIGGNHKIYKNELFLAYSNWAKIQQELTLTTSNEILNDSEKITYLNLGISILIMITVIITLFIIRSFVNGKIPSKRKR
jgi:hypothetical protein